ncbi:MAG: hypothetical protein CMC98_02935 [Flavobacteriales bacterium]|nr:hypothetical protein [Flavobacteriales bacterium]
MKYLKTHLKHIWLGLTLCRNCNYPITKKIWYSYCFFVGYAQFMRNKTNSIDFIRLHIKGNLKK